MSFFLSRSKTSFRKTKELFSCRCRPYVSLWPFYEKNNRNRGQVVFGLKYQALNLLIIGELFLKRPGKSDIQNHDSAQKKKDFAFAFKRVVFFFISAWTLYKKSTTFKLIIHTSIKLIMCKDNAKTKNCPA